MEQQNKTNLNNLQEDERKKNNNKQMGKHFSCDDPFN